MCDTLFACSQSEATTMAMMATVARRTKARRTKAKHFEWHKISINIDSI